VRDEVHARSIGSLDRKVDLQHQVVGQPDFLGGGSTGTSDCEEGAPHSETVKMIRIPRSSTCGIPRLGRCRQPGRTIPRSRFQSSRLTQRGRPIFATVGLAGGPGAQSARCGLGSRTSAGAIRNPQADRLPATCNNQYQIGQGSAAGRDPHRGSCRGFPGAIEDALAAVPRSAGKYLRRGVKALKSCLLASAEAGWEALNGLALRKSGSS